VLWRSLVLAVLLYLTADYSDPLVPGVFWFENTDSFFVESTEARPAMPSVAYSPMRAVLPAREVLETVAPRVSAAAPPRERPHRHPPRTSVTVARSAAPESSDDH
jgi:hypothetical protein